MTNSKQSKRCPRVLVVDDKPNILMSLEFLIKKKGYAVFIACNGAEAIILPSPFLPGSLWSASVIF